MAISIILAKKILSLLIIALMGGLAVRLKLVKSQDSKILSVLALYLVVPCMSISAFQVDYTDDVRNALIIAFVAAAVMQLLYIIAAGVLGKFVKLDPIEKTSIIYSNAGNLIVPIVTSMFGSEYVIYTMAYTSIQTVLFWSHCKMTICGERGIDLKKIFLNINMIAVIVGMIMFIFQIKIPALIEDPVKSVGDMIGPISMLITGMLIGGMDLKKVVTYRRVWFVAALRLLAFPVIALLFLKFSPLQAMLSNGKMILGITMLAASAPCAATVMQMSQAYGKDAEYASACNVVTTLLCAVTMPVMMYFYQM